MSCVFCNYLLYLACFRVASGAGWQEIVELSLAVLLGDFSAVCLGTCHVARALAAGIEVLYVTPQHTSTAPQLLVIAGKEMYIT